MRKKAKIFSPDTIKDKICQAVQRDMGRPLQEYGRPHGVLNTLQVRQGLEIDKKYTSLSNKDSRLKDIAFKKFFEINEHMASYGKEGLNLPYSAEPMRPQSKFTPRENILLRARLLCRSILTPFSEDEWFLATKHGTGSSVGVPFTDTSLEAKSTLPITVTQRASIILHRYLSFDSQLKDAVNAFNGKTPIGGWYDIVDGSRATTVPKNALTDRMIAVEPTGNMFLQQGLMTMMYVRMKNVGLDLETLPTLHRERARIASITSKEATIDWSSASDCVSIELLKWLLPQQWFDCCDIVRSPFISIGDDLVELNMFSTMGNAGTFPLETLVFYCLAHATLLEDGGTLSHFPEWEDRHCCSVFGDDCIVPSTIAEDFIQVTTSVGFIINKEKSYFGNEGFRESCGGDYFRGYDTRPFYLKGPTSTRLSALEPWLYIIGNRLISKYMMCFGKRNYIYDKEFLNVYFELFRKYKLKVKLVPEDFPDDAGLKVFDDFERFDANFGPIWSRVSVNQHGLYSFLFCRFKYRLDETKFEELHYCSWLKKRANNNEVLPMSREEQLLRCHRFKRTSFLYNLCHQQHLPSRTSQESPWRQRKVNGGYVVARGYSVRVTDPRHRLMPK